MNGLRKDQQRAQTAYNWAAERPTQFPSKDYEIAVQTFAATLLTSGLAAAISVLERNQAGDPAKPNEYGYLLRRLSTYPLPGSPVQLSWPDRMRVLAVADYMLATRELIALSSWLVRACRASRPRGSGS